MTAQKPHLFRDDPLGLYLHVPFCAKACDFCAFYKERADRAKIDTYLDAIEAELLLRIQGQPIRTIFWGGGTPSLLSAPDLERLCAAVVQATGSNFAEWTVECAPNTLSPKKLEILTKHGVNRFSLGVQSFCPDVLQAIGRPHTVAQIHEAIDLLKSHTSNWNIDLIFAAADSNLETWQKDLDTALSFQPHHLSTYCLTLESDTALYLKMLKGSKKRPSAEEEARFYLKTWEVLKSAGLEHYELANFAQPGHRCLHNWHTWHMHHWIGVGPSAASQLGLHRWSNIAELEAWATGIQTGKPVHVEETRLTPRGLAVDALGFGLRLPQGVDVNELQTRLAVLDGDALQQLRDHLTEEGLLLASGHVWRLTPQGLLVADAVAALVEERLS